MKKQKAKYLYAEENGKKAGEVIEIILKQSPILYNLLTALKLF